MKKINPLATSFYLDTLEYSGRDKLLEKITKIYEKTPILKPRNWDENVHTSIQYEKFSNPEEYLKLSNIPKDLVVLIYQKVMDLVKLENLENIGDFHISEIWYNAYKTGQYQGLHKHSNNKNNIFSGVYFLQLYNEHSATRFFNPGLHINFSTLIDHEFFTFTPKLKQNDIIIFPSDIAHDVPKQCSDKLRVTVSFNVSCEFKEKPNETSKYY